MIPLAGLEDAARGALHTLHRLKHELARAALPSTRCLQRCCSITPQRESTEQRVVGKASLQVDGEQSSKNGTNLPRPAPARYQGADRLKDEKDALRRLLGGEHRPLVEGDFDEASFQARRAGDLPPGLGRRISRVTGAPAANTTVRTEVNEGVPQRHGDYYTSVQVHENGKPSSPTAASRCARGPAAGGLAWKVMQGTIEGGGRGGPAVRQAPRPRHRDRQRTPPCGVRGRRGSFSRGAGCSAP